MSWRTVVELREDFVKEALEPEANISKLCQEYGISRKSGYKWLQRYAEQGVSGLRDLSRKRRKQEQTAEKCESEIVSIREEHPDWGGITIERYLQAKRKGYVPCSNLPQFLSSMGAKALIFEDRKAELTKSWSN